MLYDVFAFEDRFRFLPSLTSLMNDPSLEQSWLETSRDSGTENMTALSDFGLSGYDSERLRMLLFVFRPERCLGREDSVGIQGSEVVLGRVLGPCE